MGTWRAATGHGFTAEQIATLDGRTTAAQVRAALTTGAPGGGQLAPRRRAPQGSALDPIRAALAEMASDGLASAVDPAARWADPTHHYRRSPDRGGPGVGTHRAAAMTPDQSMCDFGTGLRRHRAAAGLSPMELAARMAAHGLPWHGSTVSKTESGDRPPHLSEPHALAVVLDVDVLDLLNPLGDGEVIRAERAAAADAGTRLAGLLEQVTQARAPLAQHQRAADTAQVGRSDRMSATWPAMGPLRAGPGGPPPRPAGLGCPPP